MPRKISARNTRRARKSTSSRLYYSVFSKLRILFMGLIVVLSTIVVFFLLAMWQIFKAPNVEAQNLIGEKSAFLGDHSHFIGVFVMDDIDSSTAQIENVNVLHLDPIEGKLEIINIDTDIEITALGDKGTVPIRSIYAFGNLVKDKTKEEVMATSITSNFSIPIDSYVLIDKSKVGELSKESAMDLDYQKARSMKLVLGLYKDYLNMDNGIKTDISPSEYLRISRFLLGVREDKINLFSIDKALFSNREYYNREILGVIRDQSIFEEGLSIQVFNGTSRKGAASKCGQIISDIGGLVTGTQNADNTDVLKSYLITNEPDSYTALRLKQLFNITETRDYRSVQISKKSDITVILGIDSLENY